MHYLFVNGSAEYILVESSYHDKHENINHIFKNIVSKVYDYIFIGSAEKIDLDEDLNITIYDFESFFAPSDFVDVLQSYSKTDKFIFNSLFYEMDSLLLKKILECFNVQYIMENEDESEIKFYTFILNNGAKSRPNIDFPWKKK